MRLALVQSQPGLADRTSNLAALAELVESVEADIYCFPELCTTGYAIDDRNRFLNLAEKEDGSEGMEQFAQDRKSVV